jgi:hypothetical protein
MMRSFYGLVCDDVLDHHGSGTLPLTPRLATVCWYSSRLQVMAEPDQKAPSALEVQSVSGGGLGESAGLEAFLVPLHQGSHSSPESKRIPKLLQASLCSAPGHA